MSALLKLAALSIVISMVGLYFSTTPRRQCVSTASVATPDGQSRPAPISLRIAKWAHVCRS